MEYINLKEQYKVLKDEIDINIQKVLDEACFIKGSLVTEFEKRLAEYVGVKHVISCSDGTAALQLIYMAYGIGQGDAVFCPDMTFIASIEPAAMLGATPVFCDIDDKTYNIDPESLERQIKSVIKEGKLNPKAIVAVDFLGNPANFDELSKISKKYNLLLIEDAAQGMGASYKGKKCGSFGDIAATSFFPSKPLGCYGDGGAVFTNNDKIADVIRSLSVHGKGVSKYDNVRIGINSRLDTIQAAVLIPKLEILEKEIVKRQEIAKRYNELLGKSLVIPYVNEGSISSYAQYVVAARSPEQRVKIMTALKENDIPSIRYYPNPMDKLPVFDGIELYGESMGRAFKYAECSFGVPFSPYLTIEEQDSVVKVILENL